MRIHVLQGGTIVVEAEHCTVTLPAREGGRWIYTTGENKDRRFVPLEKGRQK